VSNLATDIYRPADPDTGEPIDDPKPVLLDRTPYGKRGRMERHGEWFAERGYVVAIQDCRGRFNSGGDYYIFVNEPEDGYDTVEWLADQPYCDEQVGTIGTSYGAWVQNALATQDPPHLEAMFINQGPPTDGKRRSVTTAPSNSGGSAGRTPSAAGSPSGRWRIRMSSTDSRTSTCGTCSRTGRSSRDSRRCATSPTTRSGRSTS